MIKPTVGRIVLFHPGVPGPANTLAAIVAFVHSDSMVTLTVFGADGSPRSEQSVPLVQQNEESPGHRWCEWMPYQLGQAAKTEAAEKALIEKGGVRLDTHSDASHLSRLRDEFMGRLRERAEDDRAAGRSKITGGADGEESLAEWKASNGVHVRQLPPDEQGILRISVGGGDDVPVPLNYVVFRGSHGACVDLLRKALHALAHPRD